MVPNKKPRWESQRGRDKKRTLAFAVLETFASAWLAVLLAFAHARVAREQSFSPESGSMVCIPRQQSAAEAMAHRAGLAIQSAAVDGDAGIKLVHRTRDNERL